MAEACHDSPRIFAQFTRKLYGVSGTRGHAVTVFPKSIGKYFRKHSLSRDCNTKSIGKVHRKPAEAPFGLGQNVCNVRTL